MSGFLGTFTDAGFGDRAPSTTFQGRGDRASWFHQEFSIARACPDRLRVPRAKSLSRWCLVAGKRMVSVDIVLPILGVGLVDDRLRRHPPAGALRSSM